MSRFVSGGTNEEPLERDEAWQKVQQEIEAKAREKADLGKQDGGKSLYETLQANKAAKQEEFESRISLKNQFVALNEDEVEFLDSVLETTRAKEAAVKKQTAEDLEAFRKQQEDAEKASRSNDPGDAAEDADSTTWVVGKKRKKGREDLLGGVKLRKASSSDKATAERPPGVSSASPKGQSPMAAADHNIKQSDSPESSSAAVGSPTVSAAGLGLAAYSSDDDD